MPSRFKVSACTGGQQEPLIQVEWGTITDAVDSFMELAKSYDVQFTERHIRLLLTLMLGDHYHNHVFQMLAPDHNAVLSITKITDGIPSTSER